MTLGIAKIKVKWGRSDQAERSGLFFAEASGMLKKIEMFPINCRTDSIMHDQALSLPERRKK